MADLITLAEYKAYADISSDTQDSTLKSLIPAVSELIRNMTNSRLNEFVDDPKVQIFNGGTALTLLEAPVISVNAVEYSADYGLTYTPLTEFVDWTFDQEQQNIRPIRVIGSYPLTSLYAGYRLDKIHPHFPKQPNAYRVTYNAGYSPLPLDLKQAVIDTVTYYLKNNTAIHSPKAPGSNTIQIEYVTKARLPAHIQRILDLYTVHYM